MARLTEEQKTRLANFRDALLDRITGPGQIGTISISTEEAELAVTNINTILMGDRWGVFDNMADELRGEERR